jgi:hypothetical protein
MQPLKIETIEHGYVSMAHNLLSFLLTFGLVIMKLYVMQPLKIIVQYIGVAKNDRERDIFCPS